MAGWLGMLLPLNININIQMSSPCILYDTNGDEFHLNQNYIRYGNRILDASFIATISVKKQRLLFNSFKQNTTLPVFSVPFKKESDARQAMNKCMDLYELTHSNPFYREEDDWVEVFLVDAYGGVMHVNPDFLKYRDRVLNTSDVRTVHLKGRRVLVNHFKGNMNVPTMCVHFADKDAAANALNCIQSVVWNVETGIVAEALPEDENENENENVVEELENFEHYLGLEGRMSRAMKLLDKPADPIFLKFMAIGTFVLLFLSFMKFQVGSGNSSYDEL